MLMFTLKRQIFQQDLSKRQEKKHEIVPEVERDLYVMQFRSISTPYSPKNDLSKLNEPIIKFTWCYGLNCVPLPRKDMLES